MRNLPLTFDYSTYYIQSKVRGRFHKILWPSQEKLYVVPVKPIKSNLRKPNFINKFLSTSGHTDSNIVQSKKDEKKRERKEEYCMIK